ncbi:uncharacterized protein LOC143847566 isoform X1 [Tasmannia lanceolata]|uniref:uncharacterized protein LOC143847566 isoform X1 n=2 Tax=Tasmannia lanceolata TaxID=3420 RepID=UPI0040640474
MLDMFDFRDNIWLAFATLPYHFLLVIPSCFRHRTTMVRARIKLLDKIVRKRREGAFDGKDHGCQQEMDLETTLNLIFEDLLLWVPQVPQIHQSLQGFGCIRQKDGREQLFEGIIFSHRVYTTPQILFSCK